MVVKRQVTNHAPSARLKPRAQRKHGEHKKGLRLSCTISAQAACSSLYTLALPGTSEGAGSTGAALVTGAMFSLKKESCVSLPGT